MHDWERSADNRALADAARNATGLWIAALFRPVHFITLTHRPLMLTSAQPLTMHVPRYRRARSPATIRPAYTRVGLVRHNGMVRRWFDDDVRRMDPTARMWGETELHAKGDPHEHLLLEVAENAPVYSMLDAWFDRPGGGTWDNEPFSTDPSAVVRAAAYVVKAAKYAGKLATQEPHVFGFGLRARASFSTTWTR